MTWWQGVVLGVVQGLTEFLPISSTAHLRIIPALLGWPDVGTAFSAVIQLGTLVAVCIYFRVEIVRLALAALGSLYSARLRCSADARLAWALVAGNVPIVVLGLSFRHWIETEARALWLVASMLIAVALLLLLVENRASRQGEVTGLGFWGMQLIGCFQALALIPGASRSGVTLLGGLLLGLRREEAARCSFLLGIPAILGSGLFQLKALLEAEAGVEGLVLMLALAAALLSGYATIAALLRFLRTHSTRIFAFYRIGLGLLVLGWGGWLH